MTIPGKVHEVGETQVVSETFKKRELIVEYAENPTYPEYIKVDALQDKVSLFDGLKAGDEVDVSINLRGKPWTNKEGKVSYFNSLVAWRVDKKSGNNNTQTTQQVSSNDESDDLPF